MSAAHSGKKRFLKRPCHVQKVPIQYSYVENVIQEDHIHAYVFICKHKPSRRRKKRGVVFQTEF